MKPLLTILKAFSQAGSTVEIRSTMKTHSEFVCESGHTTKEAWGPCEVEKCQACCQHDEREHNICLNCDHEQEYIVEYAEED